LLSQQLENLDLTKKISIQDYQYFLPDDRIAKYPLSERDQSRLLIYSPGKEIHEDKFVNISRHLPSGCMLVKNNTRVIYARIFFQKSSGAEIEIFCLKPFIPADFSLAFQSTGNCEWECIVGNSRRWKGDILDREMTINHKKVILKARKISKLSAEGIWHIRFSWDNQKVAFGQIIKTVGEVPIPPYLSRKAEDSDKISYQTIYSRIDGSVAAPTAGLHFTDKVLKSLSQYQIHTAEITLHVGAGTFQPVKSDMVWNHRMHSEEMVITEKVLHDLISHAGHLVAVGTTSVRTLESIYWLGVKLIQGYVPQERHPLVEQWESYRLPREISRSSAISSVMQYLRKNRQDRLEITTQLMIIPGYRFRMIKGMITNFHQPKSTLLLLIAAYVGEAWQDIYKYALENGFRFLSYGDASLLLR
jgi:S-adenosylmethionine:tRNA ribosyltransferase-isomerase